MKIEIEWMRKVHPHSIMNFSLLSIWILMHSLGVLTKKEIWIREKKKNHKITAEMKMLIDVWIFFITSIASFCYSI
jgi:hypothetical protein